VDVKECAFCPNPADSKEDIFSKWMSRLLGPHPYQFRRWNVGGRIDTFKGKHLNYKAPVVCTKCNNEWMSDLENKEAKPILAGMIAHGFPLSILPRGLASLAAFAFKTTVVINHMRQDWPPFFSRGQRHEFARTLRIPSGVQMWIATRGRKRTGRVYSLIGRTPRNILGGFELYICTFAISYVVLQVVAARWSSNSLLREYPFPGFRQDARLDSAATPFWPLDGKPVQWPPPQFLSDDAFEAYCNRWKDFEVPQWMMAGFPS
jgi:hypothetical protein